MPRKRIPKTLSGICMAVIVVTIHGQGRAFQKVKLPSYLTVDLIKALRVKGGLTVFTLKALLNSNLQHLDLHYCCFYGIETLPALCKLSPNLVYLNLSGWGMTPPEDLSLVFRNVKNLKSANLRNTECNDTVVRDLGLFCPDLEELDVRYCPQVSVAGFRCDEPRTQFRKLKQLHVFRTKIGTDDAAWILKSIPGLEYFDFPISHPVLGGRCCQSDPERLPEVRLQLRTLNFEDFHLIVKLPAVLHLCPNVQTVYIANASVTDEHLVDVIPCLKQIRELKVGNCRDSTVSFARGIFPILEAYADTLTTLCLFEIPRVDLSRLSACTSLRTLELLRNTYDSQPGLDVYCKSKFAKLESLSVVCTYSSYLSEQQLRFLLGNVRNLKSMFLQRCKTLNRQVFCDAVAMNPMERLESMHLEYCDEIKMDCVERLLKLENQLREVKVYSCKEIGSNDARLMNEFARLNNLDVQIEWNNLT